jgi:LMBR1 domain-containing protein 1
MGAKDLAIINANTDSGMNAIEISINPATFYAGLMAWMGWFLFACFGGIGMAALPLDLILTFVNRPHHMDAVEFAEAQQLLRKRVNELVSVGELLKMEREEKAQKNEKLGWREQRKVDAEEKKVWLQFQQAVYLMEEDAEEFANCTENYRNYNPLIPIFSLLAGMCALIISLCWVLQIILYMLPNPPVTPFLNDYFRWFDTWFGLFGVLSVAIFSFYLLICAVKGCFKFGLRFLFFQVHPMKLNKTYMSSFLFNTGLVLLCALPGVQFSASAFQDYARFTTVSQTFNVQLYYLKFFGWFWRSNVFVYAILVILLLTCIYLGCKPKDTAGGKDSIGLRDRIRARSG